MYIKTLQSKDESRVQVMRSHHNRSKPRGARSKPSKRSESEYGSKSYLDALQRAFKRAKQQIFFNPDMQYFVTLTYAGLESDYTQVMHDIKMLVKSEKRRGNNFKYIYVLEWQKRGSLHVHMITNAQLTTHLNKNGYKSLTYWKHGFTSMLHIKNFDKNFKPYLYLFKYMKKAQRIGKTFVHASRNLDKPNPIDFSDLNLENYQQHTIERTHVQLPNGKKLFFYTDYLKRIPDHHLQLTRSTVDLLHNHK